MPSPLLTHQQLFDGLYSIHSEEQLDEFIDKHLDTFKGENWYPLGGNENNYGVIENQQASPIAAYGNSRSITFGLQLKAVHRGNISNPFLNDLRLLAS